MNDQRYEQFYEKSVRPFAPNLDGRTKTGDAIQDGQPWWALDARQQEEIRALYDKLTIPMAAQE